MIPHGAQRLVFIFALAAYFHCVRHVGSTARVFPWGLALDGRHLLDGEEVQKLCALWSSRFRPATSGCACGVRVSPFGPLCSKEDACLFQTLAVQCHTPTTRFGVHSIAWPFWLKAYLVHLKRTWCMRGRIRLWGTCLFVELYARRKALTYTKHR